MKNNIVQLANFLENLSINEGKLRSHIVTRLNSTAILTS